MSEERNARIGQTAEQMEQDGIKSDEQNPKILKGYITLARRRFGMGNDEAKELVYESLLYLKLKDSDSADPLRHGQKFGAGFS